MRNSALIYIYPGSCSHWLRLHQRESLSTSQHHNRGFTIPAVIPRIFDLEKNLSNLFFHLHSSGYLRSDRSILYLEPQHVIWCRVPTEPSLSLCLTFYSMAQRKLTKYTCWHTYTTHADTRTHTNTLTHGSCLPSSLGLS
jgi:hypothetical protein